MNTITTPISVMFLQWSFLLALAWIANVSLRKQHARWRVILWRSVLCLGLAVPLAQFLPTPVISIPAQETILQENETLPALVTPKTAPPRISANPVPPAPGAKAASAPKAATTSTPVPQKSTGHKWSMVNALVLLWLAGAAFVALRLLRLQLQLNQLIQSTTSSSHELQNLAVEIRHRLGVSRAIKLRVSDSVRSPFACGLTKPFVVLPQQLLTDLPSDELTALLSHEIAHFRRNDLFWCVAWRWTQAVFWFHPLIWNIPAAHNLACEQEADRIASGQVAEFDSYSQLLARLTLRILSVPKVETQLSLNATSQIKKRLDHLADGKATPWNRRHSTLAFGLAALLFFIATACQVTRVHSVAENVPTTIEFKTVPVLVQDAGGKPIAGAAVKPFAFRVKGIHSPDAYGWRSKQFGPAEKAITDVNGKALVKYPVIGIPEEKEMTGALCLTVKHPDFADVGVQTYYVDQKNAPVQMSRGISLEVSGYFGADHQPVKELIASLNQDGIEPEDWQKSDKGSLALHKLSPGAHLIRLMGRLPSGEIVFSETQAFTAEAGKAQRLALEMKPGIRLEGHLDSRVPRPVTNGRVMINTRPPAYPALKVIEDFYDLDKKHGGRLFWHSYRPINEDGTFVFESVPPGEVDVVVLGDGFVSKSYGELKNRVNGNLVEGAVMTIPQEFPLLSPVTKIEVITEAPATLEFTATTKRGKPLEGVWLGMFPATFRMPGMFGWTKDSSEEPFRAIPRLPELIMSGKTDANGRLIIKNIPPRTRGVDIDHPDYQVPLQDPKGWRDRHVRARFASGSTNHLKLALEPKGTDFIGMSKR